MVPCLLADFEVVPHKILLGVQPTKWAFSRLILARVHDANHGNFQVGKTVGGLTGGKKEDKGDDDEGSGEQLRLRIELNLDVEIQLKVSNIEARGKAQRLTLKLFRPNYMVT